MTFEGLLPRFTSRINWAEIKKVGLTSLPRTFTLSANELAEFFLVSAASFMVGGSISIFNFAFNLQSVPPSPHRRSAIRRRSSRRSRSSSTRRTSREFMEKMIAAAQHIIFWSMPVTVLFVVLRAQIVRTVLGAGKFDWADTRLTAATLALFIISTIGQSLIVLFVRAFYAEGKTARPLYINAISAASIVGFSYAFIFAFQHSPTFQYFYRRPSQGRWPDGHGRAHAAARLHLRRAPEHGPSLADVRRNPTRRGFTRPVLSTLFHSFAASVIMGYATFLALRAFSFLPLDKTWGIFLQGFLSGAIGIVVLILVLIILRTKNCKLFGALCMGKIWARASPAGGSGEWL